MLAMADRKGRVWASIPGLASRAKVTLEETEAALTCFLSPDKYSRTQDYEGRRIKEIDGGWLLLNHAKYRAIRDEEERRAYKTMKQREYRAVDNVDKSGPAKTAVDGNGHNAEAEADIAEADTERGARKRASKRAPSDFVVSIEMYAWAQDLGVDAAAVNFETDKFRDHEFKSPRKDWQAVWRNWIRRYVEDKKGGTRSESFDDIHARVKARAGLDKD